MKDIYESINHLLKSKEDFVLATILKKAGSAPREEGAKMLIRRDFSIIGTIGGGLMEAMAIKAAAKVFESKSSLIEEFILSNKEAASLGMVCGGDIRVLLEYLDGNDEETNALYNKFMELQKSSIDFVMITQISEEGKNINSINKWICTEEEFYGREDEKLQVVIREVRKSIHNIKTYELELGKDKYMIEGFLNYERLFIIGAGHVAQKISDIMKILGFYVIVIDDREEFANRERFNTADEIKVIPSLNNLFNHIKINNKDYVIIVTRGHIHDKDVLAQILTTSAKYIGMIGSRKKRDFVYENLLKEGFTTQDIKRVYCPIGLPIHADTPGEIAISIAAEIIKVKKEVQNEK